MAVEKLIVDHIDTWTTALQTRSTAGRGRSGKIDLYGIKKLRELILELAVRGKLVPQDPNDEPASVLLERIAAEKAELVKQGKIKKPKPLPEISEEEKPFELPEGWEWARLGQCAEISGGKRLPASHQYSISSTPYIYIRVTDMKNGTIKNDDLCYIKKETFELIKKYTISEHDLYITIAGTIGEVGIVPSFFNGMNLTENAAKISNISVDKMWLKDTLSSPFSKKYFFNKTNQLAQPKLALNQINNSIIPIPPLLEQLKIRNRVEALLGLCDQLEQHSLTSLDAHQQLVETLLTTLTDSQNAEELAENWARISEHFDTLFTTEASIDALKQTILQLAVMGKLVPQDPNDEPASELLKRIAQEKAQLVKDGKIKKQKPLPPISDEEKPFELPERWEWCLFEDVVDIQSGITKGRNLANRKLISIPYLRVANVQRGYLDLSEVKEIDIPEEEKDKYHVIKGDLLITEGGDWDTVGRTTVWCHDWYIANQNHVFKGRIIGQDIDPYWLETYMNSPYSRDYFASASKQTTNLASINKTQLRGCPVAIPPSSEAEKIMLKLNDFNELCEKLKLQIQSAQQIHLHLADALTDAAIN
ncbi:restriction endonuclease subunit S [Citrobacter freundii]|uniref:restriction endonuclease subunit S n=1 Tax=Citrobacter freundii TaxID=546 RepID=UPI0015F70B79|nr:restriction endonuclease subunit S [Citrobacter freundii]